MKLLLSLLLIFSSLTVKAGKIKTHLLLDSVIVTGGGPVAVPLGFNKTFHIIGAVTASTGAASVRVEASNDGVNWVTLDTLALTLGTTVTSDTGVDTSAWKFVRAFVASISGTNAFVTLTMANEVD